VVPAARSPKLLRREGLLLATVELRLPNAKVRNDCFGFADLLTLQAL
jgi:hypothetical protein